MNLTVGAKAAWALASLLTAVSVPASAAARNQQDDPFERLKAYDFQARQPVEAIRVMIDRSLADRAAIAQIEQKLDAVLSDSNATFAGKQEAARFLWIIGSARSVPVLSKLLVDEKLSDVARYALERDTDPAAGRALVAALPNVMGKTLVGIVNSIGDRGDASAAPALKKYISDADPLVAEAATVALGKIGTTGAVTVLRSLPPGNATAGIALRRSAEKLASAGRKADAALIYGVLWNPSRPSNIRGEAVRGLANMGAPNASSVALAALKSDDTYVQLVGAQVIATMADPRTEAQAAAAWPGLPAPTQVALLTIMAGRRDAAAGPIALSALSSTDPSVRAAGIRASGQVGGPAAVPRLIDVMLHGEGQDRNLAREALASMPGADAEKEILDRIRSGAPDARAGLMAVLVDRPSPAAMATLLQTARGTDGRASVEAIRALGRVGGSKEHGELIGLLVSTNSDEVRDAAKDAIVSIGQRMGSRDTAAGPVLTAYSSAPEPARVTLLAVMAESGGDRALDELKRQATSNDPALKQAAIRGLAETWPDSRPLATLLDIAKTDSSKALRVQALRGYLRLLGQDEGMPAPGKVERVAAALKIAERPEEKRQALSVLRDTRVPEAMDLASQSLTDPDLFGDAADTVIYLAGKQRKNNRDLVAVTGPATNAALDRIIATTKDDNQRAAAQKIR